MIWTAAFTAVYSNCDSRLLRCYVFPSHCNVTVVSCGICTRLNLSWCTVQGAHLYIMVTWPVRHFRAHVVCSVTSLSVTALCATSFFGAHDQMLTTASCANVESVHDHHTGYCIVSISDKHNNPEVSCEASMVGKTIIVQS